jgi:hypothetical protein
MQSCCVLRFAQCSPSNRFSSGRRSTSSRLRRGADACARGARTGRPRTSAIRVRPQPPRLVAEDPPRRILSQRSPVTPSTARSFSGKPTMSFDQVNVLRGRGCLILENCGEIQRADVLVAAEGDPGTVAPLPAEGP